MLFLARLCGQNKQASLGSDFLKFSSGLLTDHVNLPKSTIIHMWHFIAAYCRLMPNVNLSTCLHCWKFCSVSRWGGRCACEMR